MKTIPVAAAALLLANAGAASAQPRANRPGSLLIHPLATGMGGEETLIAVTNTNTDFGSIPGFPFRKGDVRVVWSLLYADVGNTRWTVADGSIDLSPGDTFAALASTLAAYPAFPFQGYLYLYATGPSGSGGGPIDFDFLTGEALIVGLPPRDCLVALPAIPFKSEAGGNPANPRNAQGWAFTDLNGNGRLDFDGMEYVHFPDALFQPVYLDQGAAPGGILNDEIVLLVGRGDARDLRVTLAGNFFDNRETASSFLGRTFFCWTRTRIRDLSGAVVFREPRVRNNGPLEQFTGWISVRGDRGVNVLTGQQTRIVPLVGAFIHRADTGPPPFVTGTLLWWDGIRGNATEGFAFLNQ